MIDSELLRTFASVARNQSFSGAAKELGKTQSAVSQSVRRLETELGQALLIRGPRRASLTRAGELSLTSALETQRLHQQLRSQIGELESLNTGELRIGASDTLAYYFLPRLLRSFHESYPGVEIRMRNHPSPVVAQLVAEREVDVGIVTLPLPQSVLDSGSQPGRAKWDLTVDELAPQPDVVICSLDHPLRALSSIRLADLADENLLLLDQSTASRSYIDRAFQANGVNPTVSMEMNSIEVIKRMVELGFGVSIVPQMSVQREAEASLLHCLPIVDSPGAANNLPQRKIGMLLANSDFCEAPARAFAELTRKRTE